jgi:hypothetical protein
MFVDEELNLDNQQPVLPATSVKSIIEKFNRSNSMQLVNPIIQATVNHPESIDSRHSRFGLNNGGDVVYSHIDGNCVNGDDEDDDDEWDDDDEDDEDENNTPAYTNLTNNPKSNGNDEIKIEDKTLKCRYIADEYCKMEEKQAKLCMILANNVYKKMEDENKQQKLCDHDDLVKLFYCCIETEKLAQLIHKQIALEIRERLNNWSTQPFFGDILLKYYHYYKLYKAILQRYPLSKETLVELLKKQKFAASLQKIMVNKRTFLPSYSKQNKKVWRNNRERTKMGYLHFQCAVKSHLQYMSKKVSLALYGRAHLRSSSALFASFRTLRPALNCETLR